MANKINENPKFEEQNAVFDELDKTSTFLMQKVGQSNKELDKGLIIFFMHIYSSSENQLISALHSFGGFFLSKSRRRIQVQPGSVTWRNSKIGSRRKQDTRGSGRSLDLSTHPITTKRQHSLSNVTSSNSRQPRKSVDQWLVWQSLSSRNERKNNSRYSVETFL